MLKVVSRTPYPLRGRLSVVDGVAVLVVDVLGDVGAAWAVPVVRAGVVLSPRARTPAATKDLVVEGIRAL
jgi:hypothetical protein